MTFEEWWADIGHMMPNIVKIDAREAWQAATLAEREACAKVCDAHSADYSCVGDAPAYEFMEQGARSCAAAIRERSK